MRLTMKTSNSSRQRNGASMASQRDMMKQTVVKERSPPERDFVFFVDCERPEWTSTFTCRIVVKQKFMCTCNLHAQMYTYRHTHTYMDFQRLLFVVEMQFSIVTPLSQEMCEIDACSCDDPLLQTLVTRNTILQTSMKHLHCENIPHQHYTHIL